MAFWDDEKKESLRKHWENGLSAAAIAAEMGCFKHCEDGGRSAVIGQVGRLRKKAEKEQKPGDVQFWSRGARKGASSKSRTVKSDSVRASSLKNRVKNAKLKAAETVVVPYTPPTEAEIRTAAAHEIHVSASFAPAARLRNLTEAMRRKSWHPSCNANNELTGWKCDAERAGGSAYCSSHPNWQPREVFGQRSNLVIV
jgi:hypothetical protein